MSKRSVVRSYRRGRLVRLFADIKWKGYSSATNMKKHLGDFICSKKANFKRIFSLGPASFDQIEISIECGKVEKRSFFVFLRCSRKKSRIYGACSTNKLVDLINDFDFLKEQMNNSNLTFTLSSPKVFLDSDKPVSNKSKIGKQMKSILPQFLGTIGFISGAIPYLIFGEFNQFTTFTFILGLLFWMGSIIFGSENQSKFVLIEKD